MDMRAIVPTRALLLLMAIGFLDLTATAILHSLGMIQEMNPLMRVFIEQSEWLFVLVKGATLIGAWVAMAYYAKVNAGFVRRACLLGSGVYLAVWLGWFVALA